MVDPRTLLSLLVFADDDDGGGGGGTSGVDEDSAAGAAGVVGSRERERKRSERPGKPDPVCV